MHHFTGDQLVTVSVIKFGAAGGVRGLRENVPVMLLREAPGKIH